MSSDGPLRVVFYSQEELHRRIGKEAADLAASSIPFKVVAWAVAYSSEPGKRRRAREHQERSASNRGEATHEASVARIFPNPSSLSVPLLDPWRPRKPWRPRYPWRPSALGRMRIRAQNGPSNLACL